MGNKDTLVSPVVNGDAAVSGDVGGARASLILQVVGWEGSKGSVDDGANWNGVGVLYESHVGGVRGGCIQVCSSAFLASFAVGMLVPVPRGVLYVFIGRANGLFTLPFTDNVSGIPCGESHLLCGALIAYLR